MNDLEIIEKYVVYLIGECGLSVTLHPMESEALITFSPLMRFNTHDNSYCTGVKWKQCGYEACLNQQRRVFEKISKGGASFCGVCHAGIFEYVYPIRSADGVIGFISVGGYQSQNAGEYINRAASLFGYSAENLSKSYSTLKKEIPDKARIDTLIYPLCQMLELAYLKEIKGDNGDTPIKRAMTYIQKNYSTPLNVEDICKHLGCSRSYFSHAFKRGAGLGFREYLINIRIENAKRLLTLSELNVTEIAFSVGFSDSNYFTSLFKKKSGISPLAYRKQTKGK